MDDQEWIATKKECKINSEGEIIPEKITLERYKKEFLPPHRKELIDLLIRSLGAIAIFIPLLLIYLQRQNEIKREQYKTVSELFTNVATDLQLMINSNVENKEYSTAYDNILFRYSPRIRFLDNDSLNFIYDKIIASTKNHQFLKRLEAKMDSVISISYSIIDRHSSYYYIPSQKMNSSKSL